MLHDHSDCSLTRRSSGGLDNSALPLPRGDKDKDKAYSESELSRTLRQNNCVITMQLRGSVAVLES